MNRDIVRDGVNGYWASTNGEWKEKLMTLIQNFDQRYEMGKQAHQSVEVYSLSHLAPLMARALVAAKQQR
jgi:glycosyltransferase involved in cell wall biosynthesis